MRILVLGGSWFVGRVIAENAVSNGIGVTVFNRGRSGKVPTGVEVVHGDREHPADLRRLAGHGPWDVLVDVSGSVPAVVRLSARTLADRIGACVFVSTISAYRDWPHAPVHENSPLWDGDPAHDPGTRAWDPDAYGPLKVGCEIACRQVFGEERLLIVRPHVVLGRYEYVGRLPWWLERMRRGGHVLAPAPGRSIQPVDVRDLAAFILTLAGRGTRGVFNVAAPVAKAATAICSARAPTRSGRWRTARRSWSGPMRIGWSPLGLPSGLGCRCGVTRRRHGRWTPAVPRRPG